MSEKARKDLLEIRQGAHDKINKNRIEKQFKTDDIVFVLDRYILPGNSRPLKTKFYPSPYLVVKPYYTTCLIKRLADGFTALYSMDDLKKYKGTDPIFSTLPPEVNKILLHDFRDFIDTDFAKLLENDPLDLPTGIPLVDTVEPQPPDNSDIFTEPTDLPVTDRHNNVETPVIYTQSNIQVEEEQEDLPSDQPPAEPVQVPVQHVSEPTKRITRSATRTRAQQAEQNKVKSPNRIDTGMEQNSLDKIEEINESDSE